MPRERTIGSREEVWAGTMQRTKGNLTRDDLMQNPKTGRIVSKKQSANAKERFPAMMAGVCAKLAAGPAAEVQGPAFVAAPVVAAAAVPEAEEEMSKSQRKKAYDDILTPLRKRVDITKKAAKAAIKRGASPITSPEVIAFQAAAAEFNRVVDPINAEIKARNAADPAIVAEMEARRALALKKRRELAAERLAAQADVETDVETDERYNDPDHPEYDPTAAKIRAAARKGLKKVEKGSEVEFFLKKLSGGPGGVSFIRM